MTSLLLMSSNGIVYVTVSNPMLDNPQFKICVLFGLKTLSHMWRYKWPEWKDNQYILSRMSFLSEVAKCLCARCIWTACAIPVSLCSIFTTCCKSSFMSLNHCEKSGDFRMLPQTQTRANLYSKWHRAPFYITNSFLFYDPPQRLKVTTKSPQWCCF